MERTGERLYKMREACSLLGVHPNTLRRWDKEGKIKTVRPEGGHRRIPQSEITRLLAKTPAPPQSGQAPSALQPAISAQEQLIFFLSYVFSYHRDDWELVKRAILIRDNYTCSKCGGKELLDVHHKDGTERNDPENLVTLCQKCHQEAHKSLYSPKDTKILPKIPPQPHEKDKTEIKQPPAPSGEEIPRNRVLDELAPVGIAQRTAFGDLLSSAMVLKNFSLDELSVRARCPTSITKIFCERMNSHGYLVEKDGRYELRITVVR
jgi:excisionase family DNA binding protein